MATTHNTLGERLAGGPLVLDGAMGTELERRGPKTTLPLWSASALLNCPAVVEAVHREYVAAGAAIVVANTFRTNPRRLRWAARGEEGPTLNALAVQLARRAAVGSDVLVAASVGPVEDCYCPERTPDEEALAAEHDQLAEWLRAAGPDLIWIETIGTVREALAAALAAAGTGVPFVVSFVMSENGDLLGGEPLAEAVAAVEAFEPAALGLNCIPPRGLSELLPRLRRLTGRPLAAYAHVNNVTPIRGWTYSQHVGPAEYAEYVERWLELGAGIVGGCCGTTPEHIRAVRGVVGARAG